MIATIDPATGEMVERFDPLTPEAVHERILRADSAARSYRVWPFTDRAAMMHRVAAILDAEKESFGALMTREMGKTFAAAVSEVEKCALTCRYYAEHAERMLADQSVAMQEGHTYIAFHPLGVVLAVMPWNFPFWQVIRFAAPALMAGNVALLKHASNVPRCALAIEDLFRRAGFPEGVFQTLLVGSDAVPSMIADPHIAAVTLTGSDSAGMAVAAAAGRALKKTVLELGGSDPFLVMPSAEIPRAVDMAVTARMINNGQSCIAAKRFIVHRDVYDRFTTQFVETVIALRVGDPMDTNTDIGPLATKEILETLDEQVQKSIRMGATPLVGGKRASGRGNYYQPTVLVNVPLDSPAACEELFGPVAPIFMADDLHHAISLANETPYGLGAAAWTCDPMEQAQCARELQAGVVIINGMVASDPHLPFGGIKRSGYGRELADFGIREFVNIKTIRMLPGNGGAHQATE